MNLIKDIVVYIDGASRGNPGPSAAAAVARRPDGHHVGSISIPIGYATNNVAEYKGLILGLDLALAIGADNVEIRSDSTLLVKQMKGEYRIKSPALSEISIEARDLMEWFKSVQFTDIPRTENVEADRLANIALDSAV